MLSYKMIGRNIKAARDRMGLSQEDVANELNMSVKYYGKLERGEVRQNLARLYQICTILSMPIESLFAGAMPHQDYMNRPPYDDAAARVALLVNGCDAAHRQAILQICEAIAALNRPTT